MLLTLCGAERAPAGHAAAEPNSLGSHSQRGQQQAGDAYSESVRESGAGGCPSPRGADCPQLVRGRWAGQGAGRLGLGRGARCRHAGWRKAILITTLLVMGVSTFAIGLLPSYEQVGIWSPLLLVLLRCHMALPNRTDLARLAFISSPPPGLRPLVSYRIRNMRRQRPALASMPTRVARARRRCKGSASMPTAAPSLGRPAAGPRHRRAGSVRPACVAAGPAPATAVTRPAFLMPSCWHASRYLYASGSVRFQPREPCRHSAV
jgi:hypothetical protein